MTFCIDRRMNIVFILGILIVISHYTDVTSSYGYECLLAKNTDFLRFSQEIFIVLKTDLHELENPPHLIHEFESLSPITLDNGDRKFDQYSVIRISSNFPYDIHLIPIMIDLYENTIYYLPDQLQAECRENRTNDCIDFLYSNGISLYITDNDVLYLLKIPHSLSPCKLYKSIYDNPNIWKDVDFVYIGIDATN